MRERARAHTVTGNEGPRGEEMYSSTLSLTWAQDGVGGQRLTLGKETWYPLYRRLGGPQCWFWQVWKISSLPGFDARTVQHVGSCYTRHTHTRTRTHILYVCVCIYIYIYIYICNEIEVLGMVRYAVDRRDVQDMETAWCRAIQKNDPCFQQLRVKF